MIPDNLKQVRENIASAAKRAGREANDIMLICVTKYSEIDQIKIAVDCGQSDLGENRVKDALLKVGNLGTEICWHMIGHLQTNKVKDAVKFAQWIHSVDSLKIAQCIDEQSKKIGKVQKILIEVNVSEESSKYGITEDQLSDLITQVKKLENIELKGLMTMAPICDPEDARGYFKKLHDLKEEYSLEHVSMGMTQDYEVAIEEGATMVRIGSAIFR